MNRKLYEAVFFGLRAKIASTHAELDTLFSDSSVVESDSHERAEDAVLRLVQVQGALHTLQEAFEEQYKSPTGESVSTQRWSQLELKLTAIEKHLNPDSPPDTMEGVVSLSEEDLLTRSPTLRKSLESLDTEVEVEDDEEYDEEDEYDDEGEE